MGRSVIPVRRPPFTLRLARVVVEAAACLATEAVRRHHLLLDGMRAIAKVVESLLVQRLSDGVADVHAHQVHQLERPHLEASQAHHAIDGRHVGQSLTKDT
jgi:hypothetical protein